MSQLLHEIWFKLSALVAQPKKMPDGLTPDPTICGLQLGAAGTRLGLVVDAVMVGLVVAGVVVVLVVTGVVVGLVVGEVDGGAVSEVRVGAVEGG